MAQEEEICTRISESVKMAGFLEKKGKMKIVSAWKKYWFVLEERLLLYYRSQIEYINLSPCRGSLNMGLVTTVRPGSSTGPCIIHVITRTQVVQLRAKNRETQEEWLQALLDSISLPLFSKTLKTPLIADLHVHRYSMDNIPSHERLRKSESEQNERVYQGFENRKKEMSDSFYGGSLDTVVWSKKFKTVRSSSPNIPKGKMLEKILGYVEEGDAKSTSDMISLINDDGSNSSLRLTRKKFAMDKEDEKEEESKFHFETINSEYFSAITKGRKSLSDNELNKTIAESDKMRARSREESQFERIKNAMKKTRDKAFKNKPELERKPSSVKKRRQSFLQKVFKRHYRMDNEKEVQEDESDTNEPLYDTIEHVQEQKESLISSTSESSPEPKNEPPELCEEVEERGPENSEKDINAPSTSHGTYTEMQKPIFGSKSILPAQAMSELKNKLKSRVDAPEESKTDEEIGGEEEQSAVPDLPPRRMYSRPRSPWHDVPVNNTPVSAGINNIHQGTVKFHDDEPRIFRELPVEATLKTVEESQSPISNEEPGKPKENYLNVLLEQLAEITTGSLGNPHLAQVKNVDENSWEKHRMERFSDPDYDIPRPHKLINLCISDEDGKLTTLHCLRKQEDNSDTSSSFHSIEPDSLESAESKNSKT